MTAFKCVLLARNVWKVDAEIAGSVSDPSSDCGPLQIEDQGFATCITLVPDTTVRRLHEALIHVARNSSTEKPILILQSSAGDLQLVLTVQGFLISFIEWFRSAVRRPS